MKKILERKHIGLGVTGSIACHKAVDLASKLTQSGAEVDVLLTRGAREFVSALAFTNAIGNLAESEGHHPKLTTEWGRVQVTWWTHKIRNLHRNDFIMAAKTDQLYQQ